jgi:hypothetical protein
LEKGWDEVKSLLSSLKSSSTPSPLVERVRVRKNNIMNSITPTALQEKLTNKDDFVLIDVIPIPNIT